MTRVIQGRVIAEHPLYLMVMVVSGTLTGIRTAPTISTNFWMTALIPLNPIQILVLVAATLAVVHFRAIAAPLASPPHARVGVTSALAVRLAIARRPAIKAHLALAVALHAVALPAAVALLLVAGRLVAVVVGQRALVLPPGIVH